MHSLLLLKMEESLSFLCLGTYSYDKWGSQSGTTLDY